MQLYHWFKEINMILNQIPFWTNYICVVAYSRSFHRIYHHAPS